MKKHILIWVPNSLKTNESGFVEGFYNSSSNSEGYFITNDKVLPDCRNYIGYTSRVLKKEFLKEKTLLIECGTRNIHAENYKEGKILEIKYDFEAFKESQVLQCSNETYGDHITQIIQTLASNTANNGMKRQRGILFLLALIDCVLQVFAKLQPVTKNCDTFIHLENSIKMTKLLLKNYKKDTNFSLKMKNSLIAKISDLVLGFVLISFCLKHEEAILSRFDSILQEFVLCLRQLLTYLMGSPIGLKLNHAFNDSLGRFFFYHINLWRMFLSAMHPLLGQHFKILLVPAFLGVSYQVAMFCDIISLATFHVHCIYIYAARLFSLQIRGLTSLWRLFIGRKFNPLRNRVDSCEYSSNQLFIGTLGFTILLFLLPTTAMYYTVFVTLRLVVSLMHTFLLKIKDQLTQIPLYAVILWLIRSPKIGGNIYMDPNIRHTRHPVIEIKIAPLSLKQTVKRLSASEVQLSEEKLSLGHIIHNICVGRLV